MTQQSNSFGVNKFQDYLTVQLTIMEADINS